MSLRNSEVRNSSGLERRKKEEAEGVKSLEIGKLGGNEDLVEMGEVE